MSAVVIVVVQPAGEFGQAVGLAGAGPCVGPLGDQGPVEPLDPAVGLGRVGPGVRVRDVGVFECLGEDFGPVEPLSVRTRLTVMAWLANQAWALVHNPAAVSLRSSLKTST